MMRFRSLVRRISVAAAVLAAGAAGIVLLGGGVAGDGADAAPHAGDTAPAATVRSAADLDGRLASAFAVLRGSADADDVLPAQLAARAERSGVSGLQPGFARRVYFDGDYALFAIPADDALCVAATTDESPTNAGGSCLAIDAATSRGVLLAGTVEGGVRLSGLLPDGASRVRVLLADGGSVAADVADNAYSVVVDRSVRGVSFVASGETITLDAPFELAGG